MLLTACQLLLMFYMYTLLYMLFTLYMLLNRDSELSHDFCG